MHEMRAFGRKEACLPAAMVFVVDDDYAVRDSLFSLFRSIGMYVRTFESTDEFIAYQRPDAPCCLVLDVRLKGTSGLEFQTQLNKANTVIPIIFITGHGDIPMSVRAMKAGAIDFLSKPFREQDLLDAVTIAIAADKARRECVKENVDLRHRYEALTLRERQIMFAAVAGLLNKQIASRLGISEITVKIHRANAMRKMQAPNFAALVRMSEALAIDEEY